MEALKLDGVEVLGASVQAIVAGFQDASTLVSRLLLEQGMGKAGPNGKVIIEPETWYPANRMLSAFRQVAEEVGGGVQFQIGLKVPENAKFPPSVKDTETALASIDIAYHMNHRQAGKPMFDPASGKMAEGIGHYLHTRVAGKNESVVVCDNPYPCDFDRGLITAMARRFQTAAFVLHDDTKPCRKKGGAACTYLVRWF